MLLVQKGFNSLKIRNINVKDTFPSFCLNKELFVVPQAVVEILQTDKQPSKHQLTQATIKITSIALLISLYKRAELLLSGRISSMNDSQRRIELKMLTVFASGVHLIGP